MIVIIGIIIIIIFSFKHVITISANYLHVRFISYPINGLKPRVSGVYYSREKHISSGLYEGNQDFNQVLKKTVKHFTTC